MHKCHGIWQLIPELSFYQSGNAPASCSYEIKFEENKVRAELSWVLRDGNSQSMSFEGITDSHPREVNFPQGAKVSYTLIDQNTFDSAVLIKEQEIAYARRIVSNDGTLMSVLQVNTSPNGEKIRITQVYRRVN